MKYKVVKLSKIIKKRPYKLETYHPKKRIKDFTDLVVWKEGHKLVIEVYRITKTFPKEELYSLIDQMRRAVTSVTCNIAEGFGRKSYREKLQFYYLAKGSLTL